MGKTSRTKGANFEREIARRVAGRAHCSVVRNLEEVRSGNQGDLVAKDLPITWQLKYGSGWRRFATYWPVIHIRGGIRWIVP